MRESPDGAFHVLSDAGSIVPLSLFGAGTEKTPSPLQAVLLVFCHLQPQEPEYPYHEQGIEQAHKNDSFVSLPPGIYNRII